jgi:signal transduction histidine kinase
LLDDPDINGIVDNFRDVTDRVIAEEKLKETAQRLLLATKGSKLGIWDQDIANDVLVWDQVMFELYGISAESFEGNFESWIKLLHPNDKSRIQSKAEEVMKGAKDLDVEFRVVLPNESIRHIRALAILQYDKNGKPFRLVGTNIDITPAKEYEKTLEQISFDISHVIRRPVSNMLSLTSMIESDHINEKQLKEYSGYIKVVAKELDDFTKKLNEVYYKKRINRIGLNKK